MKALLARRFVCFAVIVALFAPALLLGFAPVLLVVTPSGHEHHSHLHLSGNNTLSESRDSQATGQFSDQAFLVASVPVATVIGLVLAEIWFVAERTMIVQGCVICPVRGPPKMVLI